jgi:hypothetical protein
MKRLPYNFVVFLYAYLRQLDLSLDRSKWTQWQELKDYYNQQIAPGKVAALLLEHAQIKEVYDIQRDDVKGANGWKKLQNSIFRNIIRRTYLTTTEILYCYKLLKIFEQYLDTDFEIYYMQEKLRSDICHIAYYVVEYKLSHRDRYNINIEHYLQNHSLVVNPMTKFSKGII